MADQRQARPGKTSDNEYMSAVQAVVDDSMRTDVLGPGVCRVLNEHMPTAEKLNEIIAKAIRSDGQVKDAIEEVVDGMDVKRKSRWIDRGIGFLGAVGVTLFGSVLGKYLLGD